MSIDEPDKIDAIGLDKHTGHVVLTIADHLPWDGPADEHRELLRDKINTYLAFIESGELVESYPNAKGRNILISVIGKFELSPLGSEFLANAKQVIGKAGISLEHQVVVEPN